MIHGVRHNEHILSSSLRSMFVLEDTALALVFAIMIMYFTQLRCSATLLAPKLSLL